MAVDRTKSLVAIPSQPLAPPVYACVCTPSENWIPLVVVAIILSENVIPALVLLVIMSDFKRLPALILPAVVLTFPLPVVILPVVVVVLKGVDITKSLAGSSTFPTRT